MIKKRKGGNDAESSEKKEPVKEAEKTKGETAADTNTESEVDKGNSGKSSENAKGSNDDKKEEGGKQPSETDILKLYLKQTLENAKKQKDEIDSLNKKNEQLNSQLAQCKKQYESLTAEYENYRRRTTAEKENISLESTSKIVLAFLPTLDNLERAVPFADSNPESFKKGVEMTLHQFQDAIKSLGVEEIEAQGAEFNPELHDAVMHVEDDSIGESVITDVFQKGYRIGDKVVRHSVVKVAN